MESKKIHVKGGGRKVAKRDLGTGLLPLSLPALPAKTKETEEGKRGKFKRPRHQVTQILKYNYPEDNNPQLSLIFEQFEQETREEIETAKVEISELVEGIKLTRSQDKMVLTLSKMLHEKSQTADPTSKNYYTGNLQPLPYPNYGSRTAKEYDKKRGTPREITANKPTYAPKIAFTLYELTKEYKGGEAISGKDVDNVKSILTELANKRYLISYIETTYKKDGTRIERKIEGFKKLIDFDEYKLSETQYSKKNVELSKKEETIITLNPIFRHQIDTNFIEYPTDINRRTKIAYGSHKVSGITQRFITYLMNEHSYKHHKPEIYLDRLYWLLDEKWMKESRKKKVREFTEKAIETAIALGLLLSYEITQGNTGEEKVIFYLNKEWE